MTGSEVTLRTGIKDPIAIALAKSLFEEAGIPFFTVDETYAGYRDVQSLMGWWTVLIPQNREAEAREILLNVEATT